MGESESDFLPTGYLYIIVLKLTDEIIHAAIQSFIDTNDDSYWLKLYHTTATLQIQDINEILDKKEKENMELEARIDAESNINQYSDLALAEIIFNRISQPNYFIFSLHQKIHPFSLLLVTL